MLKATYLLLKYSYAVCLLFLLLTVTDARLVRSCSRAACGVRTLTSVRRTRRCVTTARVMTWMMVTRVNVTPATLGRRVVNDVMP